MRHDGTLRLEMNQEPVSLVNFKKKIHAIKIDDKKQNSFMNFSQMSSAGTSEINITKLSLSLSEA